MKNILLKSIMGVFLLMAVSLAYANTVTVTASPARIPADGNAVTSLVATVLNSQGQPVSGAIVNWTKDSSTPLGTILDVSSVTNSSGVAKSRLRAPVNTGATKVIATVGGDAGECTITYLGAAVIGTLDPSDRSMSVGNSKLGIVSRFLTSDGSPVADGSVVSFSSSLGTTAITQTALTLDGFANAILTSPADPGSTTVTATCGGATAESNISFVGVPATVTVTFSKISLAEGGAACEVIAQVADASGQPVKDGTTVDFESDSGVITDSSITQEGCARALLTPPASATTVNVTVQSGNTVGTSKIGVAGAPAKLRVVADEQYIAVGGSTTGVSIIVLDDEDTPVPGQQTITLTSNTGTLNATSLTSKDGFAGAIFTSSNTRETATITATCGSISGQDTVRFTGLPADVEILSSMDSIPNDGTSTCEIRGVVSDADGYPVCNNTLVTLTSTAGTVAERCSTVNGLFSAILKSDTSQSRVTVRADSDSAFATTNVDFGGAPSSVVVVVSPASVPSDGSAYGVVTATVLDSAGHAVPDGTVVNFTTSPFGTITSQATTDGGIAKARISSNSAGSATVTATAGTVPGSIGVEFN